MSNKCPANAKKTLLFHCTILRRSDIIIKSEKVRKSRIHNTKKEGNNKWQKNISEKTSKNSVSD